MCVGVCNVCGKEKKEECYIGIEWLLSIGHMHRCLNTMQKIEGVVSLVCVK